ncbi:MAG: acetolactate synthase large subunit [Chloroflexi bacterium]|nr:acetolactate synthase large subunit [Chloroflexota bacterium]
MNAAQLLVRCLENEGVRYAFGIPGEETLDLNEALEQSSSVTFIPTRHEQGAAFMADVYGRLSTYPGVCLATLGPGASNLLTGVADAQLDRAPLVAITGQAGLERVYKESHQYVDVVGMFQPVTKWNARIVRPEAVPEMVRKAFRLARLEKPGATHLELPEDIAAAEVEAAPMPVRRTTYPQAGLPTIERAVDLILRAERPVVLAGNGVVRRQAAGRGAADALDAFVHQLRIPVTHTFMAKGSVSAHDPLTLPAVGLQRHDADLAALPELAEADMVIAVGYDLVEWAPAFWNPRGDKEIIHIDSTAAEIDGHYLPAIEVVGEIGESLRGLLAVCEQQGGVVSAYTRPVPANPRIIETLSRYAADNSWPMKPQRVVADLREALSDDDVLVSDVGAHKVWISRLYPATRPNTVVIANGFAAMGIALPGAIAAKLVLPDRRIVAVSGDGGFLMNVQELETARRLGTAFVVVVLIDGRFGVIEANQLRRFGRTAGVTFGNVDIVHLAQAFGLPGFTVASANDFLPTLRRALELGSPSVIGVAIDAHENARLGAPL